MVGLRMKVMVNGTFDILHRGHLQMLQYAKSLGHHLLVAIDTDRRVKELKGPSRPINNQDDRRYMLESLRCVDTVYFFDSREELISIMEEYKPDVYVKGSDWKQDKGSTAEQYCKQVIYYDRVEPYSTTKTIQDITTG
jgi:D-beta-D-heptose 7-phosphate kinase/D-beta-D-heptose 1-phosphate adenosyltransferase